MIGALLAHELGEKEVKILELEADVKMLQDRLIERTAAYEAKDIRQVKEIQRLERLVSCNGIAL
jgi:hypothetical protein